MARFRGTIRGNRGEASRLGHASSGMVSTVDGWGSGVRVHARVDENGCDCFDIFSTGGSHGGLSMFLGVIKNGVWFPNAAVSPHETEEFVANRAVLPLP